MRRRQRREKVSVVAEITLEEEMLRKLTIIAAALAMLLMAYVPVLAQLEDEPPPEDDPRVYADAENPNRDSSLVYWPELGAYVDCSFSFFDPAKSEFCLGNGIVPSCTYAESKEIPGAIESACVGNFDFGRAGLRGAEGLVGFVQYDNL